MKEIVSTFKIEENENDDNEQLCYVQPFHSMV